MYILLWRANFSQLIRVDSKALVLDDVIIFRVRLRSNRGRVERAVTAVDGHEELDGCRVSVVRDARSHLKGKQQCGQVRTEPQHNMFAQYIKAIVSPLICGTPSRRGRGRVKTKPLLVPTHSDPLYAVMQEMLRSRSARDCSDVRL